VERRYALALVRTIGYTPLKRIQSLWEKLYDIHDLNPNLNPKNLSRILKIVGLNRQSQDEIFRSLSESDRDLIYDLSVILTNSSLNFAEYGYNKDKIYIPQVNLALFCSIDTGLPTMVRLIPGSVRDIKSLYNSLLEIDTTDKTLVIDRGFFSSDVIEFLLEKKMNFVLPARRSSDYYKAEIKLGGHFFYHERLIKYGKLRLEDLFIYLFEDQDLSLEETKR
jgi:transposase